ncbi:hypothetical protein QVD17_20922 [Tagetes erecta]|uniref:FBD domain-containing protein n=1 Tax=Tagetes erecta TaxID=13708 RepID=A0AAD8NXN5_TARER|nr:hypothetical protein QVD17_20922 [Tagetes erecta]
MLQQFLPKCPQLKHIILIGEQEDVDFVAEDKFTFFDLLQCVPMIQALGISDYYMKYLSAGGMPRKLPSSPLHLEHLFLHVCMTKQNETSSLLCMIMSSPLLVKIGLWVYGDEKLSAKKDVTNLDPNDYPDLKLDHLKTLKIEAASITDFMIDFVKLIMAKSPVLKMVQIKLYDSVSVNEELKMLKDLVQRQFPRASPSANLFIVRDKHDDI